MHNVAQDNSRILDLLRPLIQQYITANYKIQIMVQNVAFIKIDMYTCKMLKKEKFGILFYTWHYLSIMSIQSTTVTTMLIKGGGAVEPRSYFSSDFGHRPSATMMRSHGSRS